MGDGNHSYRYSHSTPGCPDTAASQAGWSERWTLTFQLWKSIRTLSSYWPHPLQSLTSHQQIKTELGNVFASSKVVFLPLDYSLLSETLRKWLAQHSALQNLGFPSPASLFKHRCSDVASFHILEEHHLITYISLRHPFFFNRCLSLQSVASTPKNPL